MRYPDPDHVWQDEEADVNDYRRPAPSDHIYPRLHGTGGIGPGHWRRQSLAQAQEDHATRVRSRAVQLVQTIRTYDHFGVPYPRIVEKVIKILR